MEQDIRRLVQTLRTVIVDEMEKAKQKASITDIMHHYSLVQAYEVVVTRLERALSKAV